MSFTGSTEIGRQLLVQCAPTVKTMIMELGGHAPLLVFADSDFDRSVEQAVAAKFATSGQDCLAANRLLVEKPIYDRFVTAFAERTSALKVGPGLNEDAEIGPLMHENAVLKCESHVADALERGARLLCGGKRLSKGSLFFAPTVLADVPADALIMSEETFGPVAAFAPFDSESEAISRANDSEYGLIAYLFTSDYPRISRLARALQYGMVAVNRAKVTGPTIPFGGVKQSGLGREGSRHGLEAFTELKYACIHST
jgi:aspartate-semialdehyde dehydrogenase